MNLSISCFMFFITSSLYIYYHNELYIYRETEDARLIRVYCLCYYILACVWFLAAASDAITLYFPLILRNL